MNTVQNIIENIEKEKARKIIKEKVATQIEQLFSNRIEVVTDIHSKETAELFYEIRKTEGDLFWQECKNNPEWKNYFYPGIDIDALDKEPKEQLKDWLDDIDKKIAPELKKRTLFFKITLFLLGSAIGAVAILFLS